MKIRTRKKYVLVLVVSVVAACVLTGCTFTEEKLVPLKFEKPDVDAVVEVNTNTVMERNFLGVGAQWSSYPWWDISDADWEKLFRRVEYMKLPPTACPDEKKVLMFNIATPITAQLVVIKGR